jgi:hypothetical protein
MNLKDVEKTAGRERKLAGLFWPIVILCGLIIFGLTKFVNWYDPCEEAKWVKGMTFSGTVTKKNESRNHGYHSLYIDSSGEEVYLNLTNDEQRSRETGKSLLWTSVNVGDSIKKNVDDFRVLFKPSNTRWQYLNLIYKECN